jgi:dihydroorotase
MTTDKLTITRPDDWHLHVRDGAMMERVVPYSARVFGRAIIMPNLTPPVTNKEQASAYRARIRACVPQGTTFTPLMTLYLTDGVDTKDLEQGHADGIYTAAKLYPAHATTNSAHGVTDIKNIWKALETMQAIGMPLLVHGEVTDPDVDIFDREKVFIEKKLQPLLKDFPSLKVVLEHATTSDAVDYVRAQQGTYKIGATITPHHLLINRNEIFKGGIRPHFYCLPIAKRETHRKALVKAATSGDTCFFLGTDSAPHLASAKESACGCAGIFSAMNALELYASAFDAENALGTLEAFASLNGPAFYGLPANTETVTLVRQKGEAVSAIDAGNGEKLIPFDTGTKPEWVVLRK